MIYFNRQKKKCDAFLDKLKGVVWRWIKAKQTADASWIMISWALEQCVVRVYLEGTSRRKENGRANAPG